MSAPTLGGGQGHAQPHSMGGGHHATVTVPEEVVPLNAPARWSGGQAGARPQEAGCGIRVYPHLDDLVARSTPHLDINIPIRTLLHMAETSAKSADTHLEFRRADLAYVDYLTAFALFVNIIPRHKDAPELRNSGGELWRLNRALQSRIDSQHEKFGAVRDTIKEDNARTGIRPIIAVKGTFDLKRSSSPARRERPAQFDTSIGRESHARSSSPLQQSSRSGAILRHSDPPPPHAPKRRPIIHPKPESLHGNALKNGRRGGDGPTKPPLDALAARFAKLRMNESNGSTDLDRPILGSSPRPHLAGSHHAPEVRLEMPSPDDYKSASSVISSPDPPITNGVNRPIGPRAMPGGSSVALPAHPPNLPLATSLFVAMPRAPSPTYSPVRPLAVAASEDSPRITKRAVSGSGIRPTSLPTKDTTVRQIRGESDHSTQRALPFEKYVAGNTAVKHKVDLPLQSSISAERLYDYIKRGSEELNILIIDVRVREQFDDGHIWASSIICVEPISLRPDMSAEDLEESLVLSPEEEQRMFERRGQFDLVVYYDREGCSRETLEDLRSALNEYNYNRPLQRPPVFLRGGLDAWVDLVGERALRTSDTAGAGKKEGRSSTSYSTRGRGSRGRIPIAKQRRRTRDHEPLNHEEETAWLERVRVESAVRSHVRRMSTTSDASLAESAREMDDVDAPTFVRTYDEFLRKYPEPADLGLSMTMSPMSAPGARDSQIDHPFHDFTGIRSPIQHHVSTLPSPLVAPSRPAPSLPRTSYSGVSEKVSYQAPGTTRTPRRPSAPEIFATRPPEPLFSMTGLTNFGATCYMNSVLQCLSATIPLTRYFLSGTYEHAVQKNKWGSNGILPQIYASLMFHLWHGDYSFIAPKTFRDFVSRLNQDFSDANVQHDANDFFVFLLDALHEDLNLNFAQARPRNLTEAEERCRESFPPQIASRFEWKRWARTNDSWISQLFSGQHMSRLQCLSCGFSSTSYETFNSISLEIPHAEQRPRVAVNIHDCLRNYTSEEHLTAEDAWTCPDCRCPREASKRLTITRAPQILVLQLKRFRSDPTRRGFTDKDNSFVDFPLIGLDLTPFALPPINPSEVEGLRRRHGEDVLQDIPATIPPFKYDAYGVVQHFGSLSGGHYKSLIRGGGGAWLEFNDRVVSKFTSGSKPGESGRKSDRRVQTENAYLLFYVRANVD